MTTQEVLEVVRQDLSTLREHGQETHDEIVVTKTEHALQVLEHVDVGSMRLENDLIGVKEAMTISGRSRNAIKGWVARRLIDGYKRGTNGELFVPRSQLLDLLEVHKVHSRFDVPVGWTPPLDFPVSSPPPVESEE